jgi:phosphohistidine phosphatase SixA
VKLYLLRHGIPVEPDAWEGLERARPLTPRGIEQARQVVQSVARAGHAVDLIWSSPYARTEATADIAAEAWPVPIDLVPGLASGNDLIKTLPASLLEGEPWPERLLVVGHMPDLAILVAHLSDASPATAPGFTRAGMALLEGEFKPSGMKLRWLKSAEELIAQAPAI